MSMQGAPAALGAGWGDPSSCCTGRTSIHPAHPPPPRFITAWLLTSMRLRAPPPLLLGPAASAASSSLRAWAMLGACALQGRGDRQQG
jgi:hypothetical protein